MKRTERRHLKENELASLAIAATDTFRSRRREMTIAGLVLLAIGIGVIGFLAWRGSQQNRAGALLADALITSEARVGPPPAPGAPAAGLSFPTETEKHQAALAKFKAVADQYPSTDAGRFARYREASTLMALGKPAEAAAMYQQVIDQASDSIYGQMAQLGLAEAQARSGNHDQAIELYKRLAENTEGPLPLDGVLMQLGRAYLEAGKTTEAQQTFNRVVEEFPESPFTAEARRELDTLKKT
jgi:TolA-binding protein